MAKYLFQNGNQVNKGRIPWNKNLKNWTKKYKNAGFQKGHKGFRAKESYPKGTTPWNKNKTGVYSKATLIKMSKIRKGKFKGSKHPYWKGGKTFQNNGYVLVYTPNHPFHNNKNYVFEHRLVMEKMLGRYLTRKEIVHHKNGKRDDNRPSNLLLTTRNKNWHPKTCPKCGFEFLIE